MERHIRGVLEGSEKGSQSLCCVGNDVKDGDSRKICITFTCENNRAQSSSYWVTLTLIESAIMERVPSLKQEKYMIIQHVLNPLLSYRIAFDFFKF